jgi:hypothetical protein
MTGLTIRPQILPFRWRLDGNDGNDSCLYSFFYLLGPVKAGPSLWPKFQEIVPAAELREEAGRLKAKNDVWTPADTPGSLIADSTT